MPFRNYTSDKTNITYVARVKFRDWDGVFGIKQADRLFHSYIIGQTGAGKTSLLQNLISQDMHAGRGCALLDPHGDLAETIAQSMPDGGIYIDIADPNQPYGYNPLRHVTPAKRSLAAAGVLEVFKKMWGDAWGVRMEHILRNTLLTLLDQPHATLGDILRIYSDKTYRIEALKHVTSDRVRAFWENEYEKYSYRLRAEAVVPIQNKVGALLAHPVVDKVLTHPDKDLSMRRIMDQGQVLIVNLSKGRLGEDAAHLLGGLLMTTIGLAAFSRAEVPEAERRDFFLYVDEFQNFTTESIVNMASELRKYHVGMVLANQYLEQLDPDIRHAVLGNVGSIISFRLGPKDAKLFTQVFEEEFSALDIMSLPNHYIYLKLMINGAPSRPFSAVTLPPGSGIP